MKQSATAGSPHRFPFVLVDRALERGSDHATAIRLASIDDALLEGSTGTTFPQSLLLEAMAQAAALFARDGDVAAAGGMLVGLNRVRFGRTPRPGERLIVEARLVQRFGGMIRIGGRVSAAEEMLVEGEVLISMGEGAQGGSMGDG